MKPRSTPVAGQALLRMRAIGAVALVFSIFTLLTSLLAVGMTIT